MTDINKIGKVCNGCMVWKPIQQFNQNRSKCRTCEIKSGIDYRKNKGQQPRPLSTYYMRRSKKS